MSSHAPTDPSPKDTEAGGSDPFASLFCEIRDEWDRAEEVIKLSEQVTADVVIPAIMELRYAGRRLVDALNCKATGGSPEQVSALLEDARFSCHRARHDAIDAALSLMSIETDRLAKEVGYDVVHNSYPDFVSFAERLDEARLSIAQSRRNRADRDTIYTAISTGNFPGLVQDFKALRRSRTTMEIIVGRKRLGVTVGIVAGLIIAAPGYLMSWYFWKHPGTVEALAPKIAPAAKPPPQTRTAPASTANVININHKTATQNRPNSN